MLALVLLLTSTTPSPVPDSMCARALRAAPDLSCAAADHGVALAASPAEAERLASYARAGEARFSTRFDRDIAPYVVVSTPPLPDRAALNAAGFSHILPWPAPRAFDEAARRSIEQGARRFAASQNMSPAQTEEVVARALSQIPDAKAQAALDAGMVPHELGHLWFTAAFWPERAAADAAPRHYGGPGPDWLDEAAAVILENEPTAAQRRDHFRALMKGEAVPAVGPINGRAILLDLPGLLAREHPGLARAVAVAPELAVKGGVGVSFTPAGAGLRPAALERVFYIQTRVFADYLIQTSGRPTILAEIAQAMADGRSFEDWLASDGAAHGLPSTLSALSDGWRDYALGV
ncbi:hypothetical protein [Brevundimonas diminuta]|uniref:hypothetical protein n=1 Tax=Brevundimonas diminuta TaxID=293 RepID=UPI000207F4F9|nr:hypothetical protein [Brevundimonas diminuta]EGF95593.1 hypothetical protein BDIM_24340 [Brevundimonas diminuta ATCC 11568]OWR19358.1 hypothetical protein CD944_09425 [Brevundimonas diminuta]WQE45603.1 hypothetical protein U0020_01795 [Brevundimonas diminuta]SUW14817.1 Uncharacterised protein [Brevundimonas diminuta]